MSDTQIQTKRKRGRPKGQTFGVMAASKLVALVKDGTIPETTNIPFSKRWADQLGIQVEGVYSSVIRKATPTQSVSQKDTISTDESNIGEESPTPEAQDSVPRF